jgi:hypothetical protein
MLYMIIKANIDQAAMAHNDVVKLEFAKPSCGCNEPDADGEPD